MSSGNLWTEAQMNTRRNINRVCTLYHNLNMYQLQNVDTAHTECYTAMICRAILYVLIESLWNYHIRTYMGSTSERMPES